MIKPYLVILAGISLIQFGCNVASVPENKCAKGSVSKPIQCHPIMPINEAEALIVTFHEGGLSDCENWSVTAAKGTGAKASKGWSFFKYHWNKGNSDGEEISLKRNIRINCERYDRLIINGSYPKGVKAVIKVGTDKGIKTSSVTCKSGIRELPVDLDGASIINSIAITFDDPKNRFNSGWINWIGLQNKKMLENYLTRWKEYENIDWKNHLKPNDFKPSFLPAGNFIINKADLEYLRKANADYVKKWGESPFAATAKKIVAKETPESLICEYASKEERFIRERDFLDPDDTRKTGIVGKGSRLAIAGIITKNDEYLRLAARYGLSLAACPFWCAGMMANTPNGYWEHRSFDESSICWDLAVILDLAGEYLTTAGKRTIQRAMSERGIGNINYVSWTYDYIHRCNQLAAFSRGRVPAYMAMESEWKRVKPYTDIAMDELSKSMNRILPPDGSFEEGPAYYQYTISSALPAYWAYAKGRNLNFNKILPESLKNSPKYVDLMISTADDYYFIPAEDANGNHGFSLQGAALMASIFPDSQWSRLVKKYLDKKDGKLYGDILIWASLRKLPEKLPPYKDFIYLKDMGFMASTRKFADEWVKILIYGNRVNAGHNHEDKGSFVLEFAGDVFAADADSWYYSSPWAGQLRQCQRHNMLVPTGCGDERPHAPSRLNKNVKPTGTGNKTSFHAEIDVTPGWEPYYKKWQRKWESPTPGELTITDTYELNKGDGVEFYWNTFLSVKITGNKAIITGKRGIAEVTAPEGSEIRLDKLEHPNPKLKVQNRIAISRKGKSGSQIIKVSLCKK